MAKNISTLSGNASEIVRAALRFFEQEENLKSELVMELRKGEKSGFVQKFDRENFIKNLHGKHKLDNSITG